MYFFRVVLTIIICVAEGFAAQADDPPAKAFLPLSTSYKSMRAGSSSATPHFFSLKGRAISKFIPHAGGSMMAAHESTHETAQEEDIPTLHNGTPEAMTKAQANQILSIFSGGE